MVLSHVPLLYLMYPIWIKQPCATNPKIIMNDYFKTNPLATNYGYWNEERLSSLPEKSQPQKGA